MRKNWFIFNKYYCFGFRFVYDRAWSESGIANGDHVLPEYQTKSQACYHLLFKSTWSQSSIISQLNACAITQDFKRNSGACIGSLQAHNFGGATPCCLSMQWDKTGWHVESTIVFLGLRMNSSAWWLAQRWSEHLWKRQLLWRPSNTLKLRFR